jgi:hypothetical protein
MGAVLQMRRCAKGESRPADRRATTSGGAVTRGRDRGREPSEEAPRQAAAIVEDDLPRRSAGELA